MQETQPGSVLHDANFWITLVGLIITGYITFVIRSFRKDLDNLWSEHRKTNERLDKACEEAAYAKGLANGRNNYKE